MTALEKYKIVEALSETLEKDDFKKIIYNLEDDFDEDVIMTFIDYVYKNYPDFVRDNWPVNTISFHEIIIKNRDLDENSRD